ncbi:MAG: DEAD/DEAH box helicase family protein [Pseudobutyrivibrio sp.]|nr:DEAD/DEAH box helicase family protein [Pseudobutyrivibrio sp.]
MKYELYDHQKKALPNIHNGCILAGGVGSGKSRTSLAYYDQKIGRSVQLYIITTAKKRDNKEWEEELLIFAGKMPEYTIDSWNNIKKYQFVENAFFIFDEDRITGNGAWVQAFLKIAKHNKWIILSATPGDCWKDYIPVFIANGFYKNKTEFERKHVIWNRYVDYPDYAGYIHTGYLNGLRRRILVPMDFERRTVRHHEDIFCSYSLSDYKRVIKDRWDIYKEEPFQNAGAMCYCLRRVVNSDPSRLNTVYDIAKRKGKVVIFYNYDYELEALKELFGAGEGPDRFEVAEWNGHKHQEIPIKNDRWAYLVQYNSGSEGWNCILTDTIIFYSQSYSYKQTEQAAGRIDRLNTPFVDLYFYHLKSRSGIDLAISRALSDKKNFNERAWVGDKFSVKRD